MVALTQQPYKISPQEYLEMERQSTEKHEYYDGQIVAMAGATRRHNLINTNIVTALNIQLRKHPCELYASDMKVRWKNNYVYPDVVVGCEQLLFDDGNKDVLLNPTLVIEILSPSTEGFDNGEKFSGYQQIATIKDYILVSQDKVKVRHYTRLTETLWHFVEYTTLESQLTLTSIDCRLTLADVYDKIEFDTPETPE
jgi:Uma2 family endonuclease